MLASIQKSKDELRKFIVENQTLKNIKYYLNELYKIDQLYYV